METLRTGVDATDSTSDLAVNLQDEITESEVFIFPMSFAQERLWFLEQLRPGISAYNLPIPFRIEGALDVALLEMALQKIVSRHEILRTTFDMIGIDLVQLVAPTCDFKLRKHDLTSISETEREKKVDQLVHQEVTHSFDLQRGPLFRGTLYKVSDEDHVLLLNMHHIVADGWSFSVILRELSECYESYLHGREPELTKLPIQYGDYAHWQNEFCLTEDFKSRLHFWKNKLSDASQHFDLPIAKPRPLHPSYEGSVDTLLLPDALTRALKKLSHAQGSTLFLTTMAAFKTLLFRYTNEADLVLGSPVANRTKLEIEDLVGCFVNTAIFRTQLSGELTFAEVLSRVKEGALETYEYQDIPFEKVVEELQPERALDRNPLVQILFMCHKANIQPIVLPDISFNPFLVDRKGAQFDMTFYLLERNEGLRVGCEYRGDLFDQPDIRRFLEHYQTLLYGIVSDPDVPISELPFFTSEERHELLVDWNDTAVDYPNDNAIHQLFEEQVRRTPEAVAIVFGEDRVTYSELNRRANQMAHHLRAKGVGPEVLVGICVERSLEMIVWILGILKAGGAYVALDPGYPEERKQFMLDDSEAAVLLTTEKLVDGLGMYRGEVVLVDLNSEMIDQQPAGNPDSSTGPDNLAYVIYTSGSTGRPKGVAIEHRSTVALLSWAGSVFDAKQLSGVLASTSICFDLSIYEMFVPLSCGGTIILAENVLHLPTIPAVNEVTLINTVPSAIVELLRIDGVPPSVTTINLAGEPLKTSLVRQIYELGTVKKVFDLYGPSEDTTYSTYTLRDTGKATIGRPISNTQAFILDRYLQPVPVGIPGELYLAGDGLARGYLNRRELTEERFISNPFSSDPASRIYKTGDMARFLADGRIEYLGRQDNQVKIRGFRIELGEIESVISQYEDVREVVVAAREGQEGDKNLAAYMVSGSDSKIEPAELRSFLRQKLPDYMIPSAFVQLERMPLTPNGKIDRKALPAPERDLALEQEGFEAPRTETEKKLAEIWSEVLSIDNIGVHDNFFDLGGHSLLAIRMFTAIEETFRKSIPLATLFEAGTIEQLASILTISEWQEPDSSIVPIQPNGSRPPLFCLHAGGGNVLFYRDLAKHLGTEQPLYGVQARRIGGRQVAHATVEDMAEFYISEIKTIQPEGPYYLGGSSFGGIVALEIAQKLHQNGEETGLLALFDTNSPSYPKLLKETTNLRKMAYQFARRFQHHRDSLIGLKGSKRLAYIVSRAKKLQLKYHRKVRDNYLKLVRSFYFKLLGRKALPGRYIQIENRIRSANRRYRPQKYPGKITLFRASNQPLGIIPDPTLGWEGIPAELEIHEVPGHHGSIVAEPYVGTLAKSLTECIELAQINKDEITRIESEEAKTFENELPPIESASHAHDKGAIIANWRSTEN